MAIAHVANRGTANVKANNTTSLNVTTTASVAAQGSLVLTATGLPTSTFSGTTVSVSGGGVTWTNQWTAAFTASFLSVHTAYFPTGLASGTTLTVTWSNSVSAAAISVHEFSGLGEPAYYHTASSAGASTTPTATWDVPIDALAIGIVAVNGPSGDSFTQDADTSGGSWGTITSAGTTGNPATGNETLRGGWKIPSSGTSQTYNPTLGTSRTWGILGVSMTAGTVATQVTSSFVSDSTVQGTPVSSFAANAYAQNTMTLSFAADGYTGWSVQSSIAADGAVLGTVAASVPADGTVKGTPIQSFTADAYTKNTIAASFAAAGHTSGTYGSTVPAGGTVQLQGPTWVSPADGANVTSQTPLVWSSVVSTAPAGFHVQLDTASDFSGATDYYSSSSSSFEYWDGSAWVTLTSSGMPANKTGNQVRFTPPLTSINATRYRRVRQSY